jgi:hypothetical protein
MPEHCFPVSTNTYEFSAEFKIFWVNYDTAVLRWWCSISNEPFLWPPTEKCGRGNNEAIVQLEMVTRSHPSQRMGHATFTTQAKKIPIMLNHKETFQIPQNASVSFSSIPPDSPIYANGQSDISFTGHPAHTSTCMSDKFNLSSFLKLKSLSSQHQNLQFIKEYRHQESL